MDIILFIGFKFWIFKIMLDTTRTLHKTEQVGYRLEKYVIFSYGLGLAWSFLGQPKMHVVKFLPDHEMTSSMTEINYYSGLLAVACVELH